jgi:hypothetical protein
LRESATGSDSSCTGFNLVGATFILEYPQAGETWTNGQQPSSFQRASKAVEIRVNASVPFVSFCGEIIRVHPCVFVVEFSFLCVSASLR